MDSRFSTAVIGIPACTVPIRGTCLSPAPKNSKLSELDVSLPATEIEGLVSSNTVIARFLLGSRLIYPNFSSAFK